MVSVETPLAATKADWGLHTPQRLDEEIVLFPSLGMDTFVVTLHESTDDEG